MGMGSGMGSFTPPPLNPLGINETPTPKGRRTARSRGRGDWNEVSSDLDLPFIEQTKRILSTNESAVQLDKSASVNAGLRHGLEQMGWQFNRIDTFKANFPFRSKWLIFDSRVWLDEKDIYRIRVQVERGRLFGYKLLKWKANTYPGFELLEWLLSPRVLKAILIFVVLFFILMGTVLSKC